MGESNLPRATLLTNGRKGKREQKRVSEREMVECFVFQAIFHVHGLFSCSVMTDSL